MQQRDESMKLMSTCYLCGSTAVQKLYVINDCAISKCRQCGFVFCSEYDDASIDKCYQDYNKTDDASRFMREGKRHYDLFTRYVTCFEQSESLLDYGCGLGYFLSNLSHMDNKYGFEVSEFQAEQAKRRGLNIFNGRVESIFESQKTFDYITLHQVIEHLPDPLEVLIRLRELLGEQGYVFITTPNVRGLTSRITKDRWLAMYPPLHLFYFDPRTIRTILEKAGFDVVRLSTENINPYNILFAKKKSWEDHRQAGQEMLAMKYSRNWWAELAFLLRDKVNAAIRQTHWGDNLIVLAKKR